MTMSHITAGGLRTVLHLARDGRRTREPCGRFICPPLQYFVLEPLIVVF